MSRAPATPPGTTAGTRRRAIVAGLLAAVLLGAGATVVVLLTGGSRPPAARPASGPRPVTAAEADRLAVMRFTNFRGTGVRFRTQLNTARGVLTFNGDVDYRRKLGYAEVSGVGSSFTIEWDAATLLAWPSRVEVPTPPQKLPAGRPAARPLAPTRSDIDAVLAVLLGLGQDRPDNAQLIRQNGARWLRGDTIGTVGVDVIQGPAAGGGAAGSGSAVTYWVDPTGHLLRVDASLGGGSAPTRIDLDPAGFARFDRSTRLAG